MSTNGSGSTLPERIRECMALAASCGTGLEQDRYLAEMNGLADARDRQPMEARKYDTKDLQGAYERGYSDGQALVKIGKGGAP